MATATKRTKLAPRKKAVVKPAPARPGFTVNLAKTRPQRIEMFAVILLGKTAKNPSGRPEIIHVIENRQLAARYAKNWNASPVPGTRCHVAPIKLEAFVQLLRQG